MATGWNVGSTSMAGEISGNTITNITANGTSSFEFIPGYTATTTTSGTTTLTYQSNQTQLFTGSTGQTIKLPDVTSNGIVAGQQWTIINQMSLASIIIQTSSASSVVTLAASQQGVFTVTSTSTNTQTGLTSPWNVFTSTQSPLSFPISVAEGGTGLATLTQYDVMVGNGTGTVSLITPSTTSGVPLISQGSSANPTYGTTAVAGGGTGLTSLTQYDVLVGNGLSGLTLVAPGAAGIPLVSTGATSNPSFTTAIVPGGGTGVVTTTAYGVVTGGTTSTGNLQNVGTGTTTQVLTGAGTSALPTWSAIQGNSTVLKAPTVQQFLSPVSSQTGIVFVISTVSSVTAGATYTNNSNTFTVLNTISSLSGLVLFTSGTGSPSGSSLVKASGTGTTPITFTGFYTLGTYTLPTNPSPIYINVKMVGGGGGGGGAGAGAGDGATGNPTTFGTFQLFAYGGNQGVTGGNPAGTGGGFTMIGANGIGVSGGGGGGGQVSAAYAIGGIGGASALGGAGVGTANATGGPGVANTGGGGGGGSGSSGTAEYGGCGGGSGAYIDAIITSPSSTYYYSVAPITSGGTAGTNGYYGGTGGSGQITVTEYYQ